MTKIIIPLGGILIIFVSIWEFVSNSTNLPLAISLAIFASALSLLNIHVTFNDRFTLSSSLISYTIATQFGLIVPYFLFGEVAVEEYPYWTLTFLDSHYLTSAVLLGCIGVSSYEIGRYLGCKNINSKTASREHKGEFNSKFPTTMLLIVLLFFMYNILSGGMRLFGTYEQFCNSTAYNSTIYPYILILFYIATIYMTVADTFKKNKMLWVIWFIIVVIFALNGNKGEFLYALLSAIGVKGVQGLKISKRMLIGGGVLVFILIPSITSLRAIGIANNISSIAFNPFGAFSEMGMQIRTTVYSLESLQSGEISYLNGASYWQPIVNILTPFMDHNVATGVIRKMFPGYGFNQVIESYLNFNIFGPILFFSLIGYYLSNRENSMLSEYELAFLGSMTTVLINATRNYFAFVPGQILICFIVYMLAKRSRNIS